MPARHHKQRDFSGGEISPRMLMRADTAVYQKSVQVMENFLPTHQGSAERVPGTRYITEITTAEITGTWEYIGDTAQAEAGQCSYLAPNLYIAYEDKDAVDRTDHLDVITVGDEITLGTWTFTVTGEPTKDESNNKFVFPVDAPEGTEPPAESDVTLSYQPDNEARLIPYMTQFNQRNLLVFTPGNIKMLGQETIGVGPQVRSIKTQAVTVTYRRNYVPNSDFRKDLTGWSVNFGEYPNSEGNSQGVFFRAGGAVMIASNYRGNYKDFLTLEGENTLDINIPTDVITMAYSIRYQSNIPLTGDYELRLQVRVDNENGQLVWAEQLTGDVGTIWEGYANAALPSSGWTGKLWYRISLLAKPSSDEKISSPHIRVDNFEIWANDEAELTDELNLVNPYSADELPDIHFVQSPYGDHPSPDLGGFKELVVTHPNHYPRRLYFSTTGGGYVFEEIPFTGDTVPQQWGPGNYPATCTSMYGRLILAGGSDTEQDLGGPLNKTSETVWGTKVGKWDAFSDTGEVDPDDSLEFTATYRSPIQWVYGHKTLLVGALEVEYIASADGIYAPNDLGIDVHSTNGSARVQPTTIGQGVLFAADQGRACRAMNYSDQDGGWVAAEVSLFVPELLVSGIRRMVRIRNPHQMSLQLMGNGQIAVFSTEGDLQGWSRYKPNTSTIRDLTVVADNEGIDIPYMTVQRTIGGTKKLYLEAIPNWVDGSVFDYMASTKAYNLPGSTITDLEHLEGQVVQAVADGLYLGIFTVTNGEIELVDQIGQPYEPNYAAVGLPMPCRLITLPPDKDDPGGKMRYSDVSVRILGSTRPIINGERPRDRDVSRRMHLSQDIDIFSDQQVFKLGSDLYQFISIEEQVPLRVQIMGVYGKLTENSL